MFLNGLCHVRKSLCRSALHGVRRDGPLASKRQTEVLGRAYGESGPP